MNTYHATMYIGPKTYRVTAKANDRADALHKIASVAASRFPNTTAKIELVEPEQIGEGALESLKKMFGFK
jgi:hypothetical protein